MEFDWSTFGVFVAATLTLYIAPGPDMIYVASRAIGQGRRAGVISAFGVSTGVVSQMLAASFGLAAVLQVWPTAFAIVKWAGVAYLGYLGIKALFGHAATFAPAPGNSRAEDWRIYRQGVITNLLNPKITVFFLAFLPQFTDPARGDLTLQMLFYGGLFSAGGLAWVICLAYLFGATGNWIATRPRLLSAQKWITGGSLLGLALFLAFDDIRG